MVQPSRYPQPRDPGRRAAVLLAAALLAVAAALAGAAPASADTIGFDGLPQGQEVTALQGVTFGVPAPQPAGSSDPRPVGNRPRVRDYGMAVSPPNVGDISGRSGEFFNPPALVTGRFDRLQQRVSVWIGNWGPADPGTRSEVRLRVFDQDGNLLRQTPAGVGVTGRGPYRQLAVDAGSAAIRYFEVGGGPQVQLAIDDLAFDVPPGTPPPPAEEPDFDVVRTGASIFELGLVRGRAASTELTLRRFAGSTGPIAFDFPGKPDHLDARVEPNPASGGDGTTLRLTVTAAPTAPPVTAVPLTVRARAVDPATGGRRVRELRVPVTVRGTFDLRVNGIEVTQGIQEQDLPGMTSFPVERPTVTYRGVGLARGGRTVVRVYGDGQVAPPGGVRAVAAVLRGFRADGTPLTPARLMPQSGVRTLEAGSGFVTGAERVDPAGAWTFTLPQAWTDQPSITLEAELLPPGFFDSATLAECEVPECRDNNRLRLTGVRFTATRDYQLRPVALTRGDRPPLPLPDSVFAATRTLLPLGEDQLRLPQWGYRFYDQDSAKPQILSVATYSSWLDITDIARRETTCRDGDPACVTGRRPLTADERNALVLDRLVAHENKGAAGGDQTVGVNDDADRRAARGLSRGPCSAVLPRFVTSQFTACPVRRTSVVDVNRPLGSVAHEVGHGYGRKHASAACKATSAEDWPPDQMGLIQGVGLDRRPGSGGSDGPYRLLPRGLPGEPPRYFDFMSYNGCNTPEGASTEQNAWVSVRGWNATLAAFAAKAALKGTVASAPAAAQGTTPSLGVAAVTTATGDVLLTRVAPTSGAPGPVGSAPDGHRVVVRGSAGEVLAEVPMGAQDAEAAEGSGPVRFLTALVPITSAAGVEVQRGGTVVARRLRSATAPSVRVRTPQGGRGRGTTTTLRWTTTDPDGDELTVQVEYSADDGRTWRTVFSGPNRRSAALPATMLAASRRARLRVRVNDGFDEGVATTARFVSLGTPPGARILSPGSGEALSADGALSLIGQGYDDRGRRLAGRSLRWFVDRRQVGIGTRVAVTGLAPGRRRVRLVATDRRGRRSEALVRVRVRSATPRFLILRPPARLVPRARRMTLRVATTVPATLGAGGRRFAVGPRSRRVVVPVPAGATALRLGLTLRARGAASRVTLRVARGG